MFSEHSPAQLEFYNVLKNSKIQLKEGNSDVFNEFQGFFSPIQGISDLCKRSLSPSNPLLFSAKLAYQTSRNNYLSIAVFTLGIPEPAIPESGFQDHWEWIWDSCSSLPTCHQYSSFLSFKVNFHSKVLTIAYYCHLSQISGDLI